MNQAEPPRGVGPTRRYLGSLCPNAGSCHPHNNSLLPIYSWSLCNFILCRLAALPHLPFPFFFHLSRHLPVPLICHSLSPFQIVLSFISRHSKSFLMSELLFCSLLIPAGTDAAFLFTRISIQMLRLAKHGKMPLRDSFPFAEQTVLYAKIMTQHCRGRGTVFTPQVKEGCRWAAQALDWVCA